MIAPCGGRAIAIIFAHGSDFRAPESLGADVALSGVTESAQTTKARSRGIEPARGRLSAGKASPLGWSSRSAHVVAFAPARFELNSRKRPSGEKRGAELSLPASE